MTLFLGFATCVGVATIAATAIVAVVGFIVWFTEAYPSKRSLEAAHEQGRIDMLGRLSHDAYWFSEDEPTMLLLQDLAEMRVEDAREKWRERRKGCCEGGIRATAIRGV